jgi:Amt family ammonium transporter
LRGFFLTGGAASDEAGALFVGYLPMAAAAVLLVVLGAGGRARGWQVTLGGLATATVIFPLVACWAWGGGWLARLGSTAGRGHGFVDHAGSGVVFVLGGLAALGALLATGVRRPRVEPGQTDELPPAHFPLLANLGALLIGLGLLGWSAGRPFHAAGADLSASRAAINVLLAGAGAILAVQTYCWLTVGHADALMSARGAAAGFVAIAAGAPFVPPWAALVTGALAGALLPLAVYLAERVLRPFGGGAVVALCVSAGLLGLLVVPLFADGLWGQGWNGVPGDYRGEVDQGVTGFLPAARLANGDGPAQLIAQVAGAVAIGLIALGGGWLAFWLLNVPYRSPGRRG